MVISIKSSFTELKTFSLYQKEIKLASNPIFGYGMYNLAGHFGVCPRLKLPYTPPLAPPLQHLKKKRNFFSTDKCKKFFPKDLLLIKLSDRDHQA